MKTIISLLLALIVFSCETPVNDQDQITDPFMWESATVYFLLTDRFYNGDSGNDNSLSRQQDGALLRNFEGGDLKGITVKIKDGYFDKLGVNAIWFTPPVEQIHSFTDEGTGKTYAYHGYWAKDWTSIDPNFGTIDDFKELVNEAHKHGIRVLMDAVINHTGPVTPTDIQWPDSWVRTGPQCTYQDAETTISCTLVENLPDIRTDSYEDVEIPSFLAQKWKNEGRYDQEIDELNDFFSNTGHPRSPRFYIMKWLTDWIKEFGIDGFRVDTVKHTEAGIWAELKKLAIDAFNAWKEENPEKVLDDNDFFMTGEVYGYGIQGARNYEYSATETVDFFSNGFENLINFSFKTDATKNYEDLFSEYSDLLNLEEMKDLGILNYISSHDDGSPFDINREMSIESGTKLLLCPGAAQIYYGDESGRPLIVEGAEGDANFRSFMNWEEINSNKPINGITTNDILSHWSKLGQFRKAHPSVGGGIHNKLNDVPYVFSRVLEKDNISDKVLVVMDLPTDKKQKIDVFNLFKNGTELKDYYSMSISKVKNGKVEFDTGNSMLLLGE